MPDARPSHRQPFHRRHVVRLTLAAGAAAFCGGYVAAGFADATASWLPRVSLTVAAVLLIVWIAEVRVSRHLSRLEVNLTARLARIEARIEGGPTRQEYWSIYSDVLNDLSGIDGETTADLGRYR